MAEEPAPVYVKFVMMRRLGSRFGYSECRMSKAQRGKYFDLELAKAFTAIPAARIKELILASGAVFLDDGDRISAVTETTISMARSVDSSGDCVAHVSAFPNLFIHVVPDDGAVPDDLGLFLCGMCLNQCPPPSHPVAGQPPHRCCSSCHTVGAPWRPA